MRAYVHVPAVNVARHEVLDELRAAARRHVQLVAVRRIERLEEDAVAARDERWHDVVDRV